MTASERGSPPSAGGSNESQSVDPVLSRTARM